MPYHFVVCISYSFAVCDGSYFVIAAYPRSPPNRHLTSKRRRIDVDTISSRRIDVNMTSFQRHVPAGLSDILADSVVVQYDSGLIVCKYMYTSISVFMTL